jgi:hypothetical protein
MVHSLIVAGGKRGRLAGLCCRLSAMFLRLQSSDMSAVYRRRGSRDATAIPKKKSSVAELKRGTLVQIAWAPNDSATYDPSTISGR